MQQSYTPIFFFFSFPQHLHTYTPSHPHPRAGLMSNKNRFPHFFELKCCKGVQHRYNLVSLQWVCQQQRLSSTICCLGPLTDSTQHIKKQVDGTKNNAGGKEIVLFYISCKCLLRGQFICQIRRLFDIVNFCHVAAVRLRSWRSSSHCSTCVFFRRLVKSMSRLALCVECLRAFMIMNLPPTKTLQ